MARKGTIKGARTWVGTMLVAWTFVSGSALVIASAHYYHSKDLRFLITWLAPPFLVGCLLFGTMAIVAVFGGVRETQVEVVNARGTRQSIFKEQR